VVVVSVDARNLSRNANTILIVPFGSQGVSGPTTLCLQPGETGLPGPSWLKAHFITTLAKDRLRDRLPRPLSTRRTRELVEMIRRAIDPDAPYEALPLPAL
jgi:mRNA-degrading endonuclease toxin of MazEF toxin-antitoxin module